jgi:hypothetical protein
MTAPGSTILRGCGKRLYQRPESEGLLDRARRALRQWPQRSAVGIVAQRRDGGHAVPDRSSN